MHHPDDSDSQPFSVTCYLDESGTDSQSQYAVVAGLVMNRDNFIMFDFMWNEILRRHKIIPPLHMKEFGQHGKHKKLTYPETFSLFSDIAKLINCHKIISIAGIMNQIQYNNIMTDEIRKSFGIYGMCFLLCAFLNHKNAIHSLYHKNIAFLLDAGNEHCGHIVVAYKEVKRQKEKLNIPLHAGSLNFDSDSNISALQAADIIAWAVRRRAIGLPIGKGFQPISAIIDRNEDHVQNSWEENWLKEIMITFKDSFNSHGL
jgi:hypothetical protein